MNRTIDSKATPQERVAMLLKLETNLPDDIVNCLKVMSEIAETVRPTSAKRASDEDYFYPH